MAFYSGSLHYYACYSFLGGAVCAKLGFCGAISFIRQLQRQSRIIPLTPAFKTRKFRVRAPLQYCTEDTVDRNYRHSRPFVRFGWQISLCFWQVLLIPSLVFVQVIKRLIKRYPTNLSFRMYDWEMGCPCDLMGYS